MYVLRLHLRRLPAVALMGLSNRSSVAALAERRCSLTTGSRLRCPCRSMESTKGVHEVGQRRLEPLSADTVRGLPDHDHRFAYGLVVDAPPNGLLLFLADRLTQQPDAVLTVMAGYRGEFVQYPPFVLLGCLSVPVPDCRHKSLLRHLADASAHVAASRVFGSILAEATTFVE